MYEKLSMQDAAVANIYHFSHLQFARAYLSGCPEHQGPGRPQLSLMG